MGLITPTLPTSGQDRGTEEVDVVNSLQTIVNVINGNLDGFNLASSTFAPYRTLHQMVGALSSVHGTNLNVFDGGGSAVSSGSSISSAPRAWVITNTSTWVLTGKTNKARLVAHVGCNNVAPGAGNLAVTLRPATFSGTAGAFIVTAGAALATVTLAPVQAGQASGVSADFDLPAVGSYVVAAQMTGAALAANVVVSLNASVELHHI